MKVGEGDVGAAGGGAFEGGGLIGPFLFKGQPVVCLGVRGWGGCYRGDVGDTGRVEKGGLGALW